MTTTIEIDDDDVSELLEAMTHKTRLATVEWLEKQRDMTTTAGDIRLDVIANMLFVMQAIAGRGDTPREIKDAVLGHYAYREAIDLLAAAGRPLNPDGVPKELRPTIGPVPGVSPGQRRPSLHIDPAGLTAKPPAVPIHVAGNVYTIDTGEPKLDAIIIAAIQTAYTFAGVYSVCSEPGSNDQIIARMHLETALKRQHKAVTDVVGPQIPAHMIVEAKHPMGDEHPEGVSRPDPGKTDGGDRPASVASPEPPVRAGGASLLFDPSDPLVDALCTLTYAPTLPVDIHKGEDATGRRYKIQPHILGELGPRAVVWETDEEMRQRGALNDPTPAVDTFAALERMLARFSERSSALLMVRVDFLRQLADAVAGVVSRGTPPGRSVRTGLGERPRVRR